MNTVKTFSGAATSGTKKNAKFDWETVCDGKIYKAVAGTDFETSKGFIVSMSRFANEREFTVERFIAQDGLSVEFRLTPKAVA